jgi:ParB family transcriptional regulator, chromosome partitioning protein
MARRRLTPAQTDYLAPLPEAAARAWTAPPIAQIAGDASAAAALAEVSDLLAEARADGRLLQRLTLDAIDVDYLVRDRVGHDGDEMQILMESLRAHGQRTPIEVTELAPGRYGLISGWRRITALGRLLEETKDPKYGSVIAQIRTPATAGDAYVAMVEENEVRLGLSYYERARIVARSVERGVFDGDRTALLRLFSTASKAKRSKIGSFMTIYRQLASWLRFPQAIPERLGLTLARVLETDPARTVAIQDGLLQFGYVPSAEEELARLAFLLENTGLAQPKPQPKSALQPPKPRVSRAEAPALPEAAPARDTGLDMGQEIRPGVFLKVEGGFLHPVLILQGPAVGPELRERLEAWLVTG